MKTNHQTTMLRPRRRLTAPDRRAPRDGVDRIREAPEPIGGPTLIAASAPLVAGGRRRPPIVMAMIATMPIARA